MDEKRVHNLRFYTDLREVPPEAQKQIVAGRLKGMTDVNPMWRDKAITEEFGPCGFGWRYEIVSKEFKDCEKTGETACFVDVNFYYRDPESGEWSAAIPGTGGSKFCAQERNGAYCSDECYKMALTDALSVAYKRIGTAADIYFKNDVHGRRKPGSTAPGGSARLPQMRPPLAGRDPERQEVHGGGGAESP